MNKSSKLLLLIVTVFLLASFVQVECRRTYSSRSSSSGRGNRGKNQPSSGGIFSSWFGGSKSSSSGSGSVSKPSSTSSKQNWQTASSHATQSKPSSGWANPYYKPAGSGPVPSAPKETNYGWKSSATGTSNSKPLTPYPSSNIGSRGYPVQSGVQQSNLGGFKPAAGAPSTNYQPSQSSFGGYRPAASAPGAPSTGYHPSPQQNNFGGYHSSSNYNPSQPSHGYHPPSGVQSGYHPPSGVQSGYHPPQSGYQPSHGIQSGYHPPAAHYPQQPGGFSSYNHGGYSPHASFGSSIPSYQGTKVFGGNSGHYSYPGSSSWGIPQYGAKKSSGTGKLLTGLAVGAAGGYLTSSLVNSISNPWKYSGYGYGSTYGYGSGLGLGLGSGYSVIRRDESAFERGYERGLQSRLNENNKEKSTPPEPEDPTSKWIQCVAFDPQTQQTLINPNCSCTVTTSLDERTGQPLSVHHCTTLNGLVMQPVPIQPGGNIPPNNAQSFGGANTQSVGGVSGQPVGGGGAEQETKEFPSPVPSYGSVYTGEFQYNGGPTIYLPPQTETKVGPSAIAGTSTTETKTEESATETKPEQSTAESATGTVTQEVTMAEKMAKTESVVGGNKGEAPPISEELTGGLQEKQKRTAEFYGQLQKIVNMGSFVDGG